MVRRSVIYKYVCIVRLARERSAAGPIRSETVPRHVRLEPPALILASNEALGRPLRGRQHRRRLIDVSLGDLGLPFGPVLQPTMVGHRVRKPSPVAGAPQTTKDPSPPPEGGGGATCPPPP